MRSANYSSKSPNAFTMPRTLVITLFEMVQHYDSATEVLVC
jgi:hypothetical protein